MNTCIIEGPQLSCKVVTGLYPYISLKRTIQNYNSALPQPPSPLQKNQLFLSIICSAAMGALLIKPGGINSEHSYSTKDSGNRGLISLSLVLSGCMTQGCRANQNHCSLQLCTWTTQSICWLSSRSPVLSCCMKAVVNLVVNPIKKKHNKKFLKT